MHEQGYANVYVPTSLAKCTHTRGQGKSGDKVILSDTGKDDDDV